MNRLWIEEEVLMEQPVEPPVDYVEFDDIHAAAEAATKAGKVIYAKVATRRQIGFIHFEVHPDGNLTPHVTEKTAKTMDGPQD